MIDEAHLLLTTTGLPEGRAERACELLGTAVKLADRLLSESPAVTLGKFGGQNIAARRRTRGSSLVPRGTAIQSSCIDQAKYCP